MKINSGQTPSGTAVEHSKISDKNTAKSGGVNRSSETSRSGAKVEISDNARLMSRAADVAKAAPDVRADKISDLKKRIQEGTYKIDSQAIADKILEEHLTNNFGKNDL